MRITLRIAIALLFATGSIGIASAYGQIAGGMNETTRTDLGGRNFIVGTVFAPGGFPVNTRIRIRLACLTSREIITTTDDSGKFVFSGVSPGTYTVNFDEDQDYQSQSQQVEIENPRSSQPQSYTVFLRLVPKPGSLGKAAVVESKTAGVPKKAVDHYNEALRLSKNGDARGAIAELKAAVEAYPKFALALTELGIQQLKTGDLEEADKSFAAALELSPDEYEPTINRGIGLFRQKRYDDAERYLRSALKLKEGSTIAHFYLGRTLMGRGDLDQAEKELIIAQTSSKDSMPEVHRMLTQLYIQKNDHAKARQELEIYITANPTAPDIEHLREVLKQLQDATATTDAPKKP
jgi:tetratricopeptide (TPR) repeat protein